MIGWRANAVLGDADAVLVQAKPLPRKAAQLLDALNRPCGKRQPCGTLATVNKTVVKIGDAVVTTQEQERAITPHTIAAMDNLNRAANALTETASAAAGTLHSASDDLKTLNTSIAATQPLIEAATATVRDYGALAPALTATAASVQGMTFHFNAIAGDAQTVADKETKDFLKPTRWYMVPVKRFGEIWDITTAVARHTP